MSFKFNFRIDDSETEPTKDENNMCTEPDIFSSDKTAQIHDETMLRAEWSSASDVLYTIESVAITESQNMYYIQPHLNEVKSGCELRPEPKELENNTKRHTDFVPEDNDLIPGIYEGRLKVWECSVDLVNFLLSHKEEIKGRVLELGCGIGLPGLCSSDLGAGVVTFQDFNDYVITNATAPTVLLNQVLKVQSELTEDEIVTELNVNDLLFDTDHKLDGKRFNFITGDWKGMEDLLEKKFDVILTAETIYCAEYYERLHNILQHATTSEGTVYLAAKSFYFGVGGGVHLWEQFVLSKGVFNISVVQNINAPLKRHILKMTFKK